MRVLEKNKSIDEILKVILQKAKYQKIIVCIDEDSDMEYIDHLIDIVGNKAVMIKYYYNKNDIEMFYKMINNGTRLVIYNVSIEHFSKLKNDNIYILNIFIPQTSFILPYINNSESLYGESLMICANEQKDYRAILYLYMSSLEKVWALILQNNEIDTTIFKRVDELVNCDKDFYSKLINLAQILNPYMLYEYFDASEDELPYYIYLKLCAILKMFNDVSYNNENYIDFYKMQLSSSDIDKAYSLVARHDIISTIKLNGTKLIRLGNVLINRFKIIIKKYFNIKNIKLNKINKLIKNQAKALNIDNLLYISYILNTI